MRIRSTLALVSVAAALVLGPACASKGDLEKAQQGLVSTQEELTKAKADQAAAVQRLAALEDQLKSAQADSQQSTRRLEDANKALKDLLDSTTKDTASLRTSLTTLQGDQAKLKGDVAAASADVPKLKTDLSATAASLGDLKGSFLLTRDDVTKLREDVNSVKQAQAKPTPTPDPRVLRASYAILALDLYLLAKEVNDTTSYRNVAARVGVVANLAGDSALSDAWTRLDSTWNTLVATAPGTLERDAAARDWNLAETAFLLRLMTLITG